MSESFDVIARINDPETGRRAKALEASHRASHRADPRYGPEAGHKLLDELQRAAGDRPIQEYLQTNWASNAVYTKPGEDALLWSGFQDYGGDIGNVNTRFVGDRWQVHKAASKISAGYASAHAQPGPSIPDLPPEVLQYARSMAIVTASTVVVIGITLASAFATVTPMRSESALPKKGVPARTHTLLAMAIIALGVVLVLVAHQLHLRRMSWRE